MHPRRKMSKIRKMCHHIPFDIQSEIIKRLPVKSIIKFRSISKQWKSLIDNAKFIKTYHINHTNPQHRLLVCYKLDDIQTYTSIIDNDAFPLQKFPLTAPKSLSLLRNVITLSSIDGLLCFYGDVDSKTRMAVIWNPSVRKSVDIFIPFPKAGYIVVGFGVCPDTSDLKLVKITIDRKASMWVVEVFTLSTRIWKYIGVPFKSGVFYTLYQAFVDGVIYFCGYDDVNLVNGVTSKIVLSFDLKSEKFGEVCLPERLVHTPFLHVAKVNESLGLLEYYNEGAMKVCAVCGRKYDYNNRFTKIYTIKVECKWYSKVLGFRNNGEVVMELDTDNDNDSRIAVYEPLSGHINEVGINGELRTFYARSYMETVLLLDESDSIIH